MKIHIGVYSKNPYSYLPSISALCGLNGKEGTVTTNTQSGIEYIIQRSNGEVSRAFCKRCLKKAGMLK